MTGTIARIKENGYAFIHDDNDVENIFLHATSLKNISFKSLIVGARVSFDVTQTDRGLRAENVEVLP
jgi:cold shock protein